jgi:hypothetical protein
MMMSPASAGGMRQRDLSAQSCPRCRLQIPDMIRISETRIEYTASDAAGRDPLVYSAFQSNRITL